MSYIAHTFNELLSKNCALQKEAYAKTCEQYYVDEDLLNTEWHKTKLTLEQATKAQRGADA